jgi:vomeronasal1 receptor
MFASDAVLRVFPHISVLCWCHGELIVLVLHVYTSLIQPHLKKPIDSIFVHLNMVNILTIIFRLIPNLV